MSAVKRQVIDVLEPRMLFAAGSITVVTAITATAGTGGQILGNFMQLTGRGTLVVHGTPTGDDISVTRNKSHLLVHLKPKSGLEINSLVWSTSQVKRILIEGNGGNDHVTIDPDVTERATVLGGAGNDTLNGNFGATLVGGAGDDTLAVPSRHTYDVSTRPPVAATTSGAALLSGGEGDDTLTADSDDAVVGGKGDDTAFPAVNLTHAQAGQSFTFSDLGIGADFGTPASGVEHVGAALVGSFTPGS